MISPLKASNRPTQQSTRYLKAAVAVLGLLVVGLVVSMFLGRGDKTDEHPPAASAPSVTNSPSFTMAASPNPSSSAPEPDGSWSDAGCNGTPGGPATPTTTLAQATWTPFLSAAIPSSPTLGPAKTDGPLRRCYQHSPAGAVMAAANLMLAPLGPNGQKVVEEQWTEGPGRSDMLSAVSSWSGTTGEFVAYRLSACTPQACNVSLAAFGSGQYATSQIPLVWRNGDWMVNGGQRMPEPGIVPNIPEGYTAWRASS